MRFKKIPGFAIIYLFMVIIMVFAANEAQNISRRNDADKPTEAPQATIEPQAESPDPNNKAISANSDIKPVELNHALLVFTFDDGNESDYTFAYAIMKKYGIKGTSYINPYNPDHHVKNKLSWQQIKEMYAYGWDFEDHTYSHIDLTKSTPEKIKQSIEKVDEAFIENGLKIPAAFAYPYGRFDQTAIEVIKQYRKQARLAFYSDDFVDLNHMDTYQIPCVSADMQTEKRLKEKKELVDKACAENAVIVFRVHCMYRDKLNDMGEEVVQTSSKLFKKLVEYCVEKGCGFTTMNGLISLYSDF